MGSSYNENETEIAENVKDVAKLCQSIPSFQDCDETNAAEWLSIDANDIGCEIVDDIDIVSSVQVHEDQDNNNNDIADDVNCLASAPSHAEAFTALETVMSWYESQPESNQV